MKYREKRAEGYIVYNKNSKREENHIMNTQYFSEEYINDTESVDLIEKINNEYPGTEGLILYKFPSIKELDKKAVTPDILISHPKLGIVLIITASVQVFRNGEYDQFIDKLEMIDNYIFTALMRNRALKQNARNLKFAISTIGYCPNLIEDVDAENIYLSSNVVLNFLKSIEEDCTEDVLQDAIATLEQATAIIKPKERILEENDNNTKARLLREIETQVARFDDEQRLSALTLLNGPQRIRGLAGSGKTIILCLKAAHLHMLDPDAIILYTFYTRSLYDYIKQLITRFYMKMTDGQIPDFDNKVHVMHAWGGARVPGVYYNACRANGILPISYGEAKGHGNAFKYVCEQFIERTKYNACKMYDYVLMDEAQDFDVSFYQLCRSVVKDDHLIWCYDEVQNIFDVILQNPKETFANEYDPNGIDLLSEQKKHPLLRNDIVLHKSYRNVKKILVLAVALGFGIYNDKLIQSLENNEHWEDLGFTVLEGDCSKEEKVIIKRNDSASPLVIEDKKIKDYIQYYEAPTFVDELDWVAENIKSAINVDKLRPEDIAVICLDERNVFNYFNGLEGRLAADSIGVYNVVDRDYVKGFYKEGKVTLSSVFKAKGNEAAMVFVVGCDIFDSQKDLRTMRNKVFTAFTRAKIWLRVSGTGKDSLKQMLYEKQKLEENNYQYVFLNKPTHLLDKDWSRKSVEYENEQEFFEELIEMSKKKGISVERLLQIYEQRKKVDEKIDE